MIMICYGLKNPDRKWAPKKEERVVWSEGYSQEYAVGTGFECGERARRNDGGRK
jgi:5,10-methenyltetrahydromethanopterin hydrogenase